MNSELLHFKGIRKKIIIFYFAITLLLSLTSYYSYYNTKSVLVRQKSIITDYVYLNELNNDISFLETEVEKYLTTKSSDALLNYYTIYNRINEKSNSISREISYSSENLMIKDIGYMIDTLLSEADEAIYAKRGRISSEYISHFSRSIEISSHIKYYINKLLNNKLKEGTEEYYSINKNMTYLGYINLFIIIISIIISTVIAILFTYRLTRPIIKLSISAERISKGDFEIEPININTDDELNVLAKAFNKMVINIKKYIEEIKGQAEVENKLKEQEMQNLEMKHLLKDAELKMLQSQINPHFLFNTLNAAAQLSIMEGAEKASEFIENVAQLFRYSLRKLDEAVTLNDEIENVEAYMFILRTRFGDKINYSSKIEEDLLDIKIPCTILQPIVENAYIHGLEDLERSGEIKLSVKRKNDDILIIIHDNGIGMSKENIKSIVSENTKNTSKNHVNGIGMHNVIDRLRLYYNIEKISDVIEIKSEVNKGTKIILKIPYNKDVGTNDQVVNCR